MKAAISPKLLWILGLSVAVALFGAWNLLGQEDVLADSGFEPTSELPIVVTTEANGLAPIEETFTASTRNPFIRGDEPNATDEAAEADPEADEGESDGSTTTTIPIDTDTTSVDTTGVPVFPNPDLVEDTVDETSSTEPFNG